MSENMTVQNIHNAVINLLSHQIVESRGRVRHVSAWQMYYGRVVSVSPLFPM